MNTLKEILIILFYPVLLPLGAVLELVFEAAQD
jgi:hypothetical protein